MDVLELNTYPQEALNHEEDFTHELANGVARFSPSVPREEVSVVSALSSHSLAVGSGCLDWSPRSIPFDRGNSALSLIIGRIGSDLAERPG